MGDRTFAPFLVQWLEQTGYEPLESFELPRGAFSGYTGVVVCRRTVTRAEYWAFAVDPHLNVEPVSFFKIRLSKKAKLAGKWIPHDTYGPAIYTYFPFERHGYASLLWRIASSEHQIVRAPVETAVGEKFFDKVTRSAS